LFTKILYYVQNNTLVWRFTKKLEYYSLM
jgi:hypothetical protein